MSKNLEPIVFDSDTFDEELTAFAALLNSKADLSEAKDIQPFFAKSRQLCALMGSYLPHLGPAKEMAFQYPFFGDFTADLLLGNKKEGEFCVVEFEDGGLHSIFKKQPKRNNPEWSARFEHGFSQLTDWFYNLDDFKGTKGFAKTFGTGHIRFVGLLLIGRSAGLDETKKARLRWRSEKVLIDSHSVQCLTFDELYTMLKAHFAFYKSAIKTEKVTQD